MITINNLTKIYTVYPVLKIPELTIEKGQSFGLVGNNGAGKTTMFSAILDLISVNSGEVKSGGKPVKLSEHWKSYTGSYLDESFLIDYLTPEEYFEFLGSLHKKSHAELKTTLEEYQDFFNGEVLGKKKYIRELSKGNQKKVGIVGALMFKPEVLILDEPFPNLDPTTVMRLKNTLRQLKNDKDVTVIISSHDLNHITEVCDRIVLLEAGVILKDIKTSDSTLAELEEYFSRDLV
jgi:ABC-2 type transport system ATP-binding protein